MITGAQHNVTVQFCNCFSEAEILMKMKLFPATLKKTTIAFSFRLFDSLEALLVERQVSLSEFVIAISFLSNKPR